MALSTAVVRVPSCAHRGIRRRDDEDFMNSRSRGMPWNTPPRFAGLAVIFRRALLIAILAACVLAEEAAASRADSAFLLARGRAGGVRLGMPLAQVRGLFGARAIRMTDLRLEGEATPAALVTVAGAATSSLTVEIDPSTRDSLITRITVRDARYRSAQGIGVGSTLGMLRRSCRVDWIAQGEPDAVARVDALGMSFIIDLRPLGRKAQHALRRKNVPDTVRITGVMLTD
jgi:hypothetical protein